MNLISQLPSILDVVALLNDLPTENLARGQVGTVVEMLDSKIALVEFAGDDGAAYAIAPCALQDLIVLRYERQPA